MLTAKTYAAVGTLGLGLLLAAGAAWAKLPPPSDEARALADAAKAKTAWSAKVAAYKLCLAQDRAVLRYKKQAAQPGTKPAASACADPGPFVAAAPAAGPAPTAAPLAAKAAPGVAVGAVAAKKP